MSRRLPDFSPTIRLSRSGCVLLLFFLTLCGMIHLIPPWRWLDANPMLIDYLPSTRMQVLLEIEQGLLAHADEAFTRPLDIDDDGQHKRNR
jgi:hypothetical protein